MTHHDKPVADPPHPRAEFLRRAQAPATAGGTLVAYAYIDIRNLRAINQAFGPDVGDTLIGELHALLGRQIPGGAVLARMWGGEFAIALGAVDPLEAMQRVESLLESVGATEKWSSNQLLVAHGLPRVSAGLAVESCDHDPDSALRNAALACDVSKERGLGQIVMYIEDDPQFHERRASLQDLQQLQNALSQGKLAIQAQPIVALQQPGWPVCKAELLLRKARTQTFDAAPARMLEAARVFHLLPQVDLYVVTQALKWLQTSSNTLNRLTGISVNLSPQGLTDPRLQDELHHLLRFANVDCSKIAFEITESAAMEHLPNALRWVEEMHELGCRFLLDDFGVGHSSFARLRDLPVDEIKIDGGFIRDLPKDPANQFIVQAIQAVAKATDKLTTAEYVDTDETAKLLQSMGVSYAQGWLFGPAMPLPEFERLLARGGKQAP